MPDSLFSSDLAADFLSAERSVEYWTSIFAQITALNSRLTTDLWKILKTAREKAQELKTPIRAYKSETPAFHKLASLWSDLDDFRQRLSEEEDTSSYEFRLSALENQIELLAKRLEEWNQAVIEQMQLNADNVDGLSTRLLNLESVVGPPSPDISSEVDPTI